MIEERVDSSPADRRPDLERHDPSPRVRERATALEGVRHGAMSKPPPHRHPLDVNLVETSLVAAPAVAPTRAVDERDVALASPMRSLPAPLPGKIALVLIE